MEVAGELASLSLANNVGNKVLGLLYKSLEAIKGDASVVDSKLEDLAKNFANAFVTNRSVSFTIDGIDTSSLNQNQGSSQITQPLSEQNEI
eukprot:CAMPEP_0196825536 /NCGR_PEP_ID=MMETSP1362-20130617/93108_1 /TAXON_ID=163516 /ORGANISM="Leptocylindrus danicus, Strain CCMP1856" /LENGTH=90 /DNA_ID=CAMNT_0042205977 /DNA_START=124 /DNA_END=396 /DNA_ORIENTATION=+